MIYRVIVDFLDQATYAKTTRCILTDHSWKRLYASQIPGEVQKKLETMKNKPFGSEAEFLTVVEKVLGHEQYTRYGNQILWCTEQNYIEVRRGAVPWRWQEYIRVVGASYGWLANIMDERGLHAPEIHNERACFYFTERGWKFVGRYVAREARQSGHTARVIRRKDPVESQVIYRDDLQVAILPITRKR